MNGIPLWAEDNDTLSSAVFEVTAGKVGVLFGVDFADDIERTSGAMKTGQTACLHKIYLAQESPEKDLACGKVLDLDAIRVYSYVDDEVLTCDGPWQLTKCKNMAIIGVPGVYYLRMNGRGSTGNSPQVYLELWNKEDIASQVYGPFFQ